MLYTSLYDSSDLRGIDNPLTPRPWNIIELIKTNLPAENSCILDLGTGTGFKVIPLLLKNTTVFGLEISRSMIMAAKRNINLKKFLPLQGDNLTLPFKNDSFDYVLSFLSHWSPEEIARVIKPNGEVFIEWIGCEDKIDFKSFFPDDDHGPRGQYVQFRLNVFIKNLYTAFEKYFNFVEVKNGYWETFYSKHGLIELLSHTPTIRSFDFHKDKSYLENAIQKFQTNNGIKLTQNRVLIHAKNLK